MTRRRWIADEFSDNGAALTGNHADHLVRVLRVRVGQEFDIVTKDSVRRGRVLTVSPSRVEFELQEEIPAKAASSITLLLAIFKFDRMEWAIEKCTELGVARIIPAIARRTDPHLASAAAMRVERWRRIALQASEQSRRSSPPEISDPVKLAAAVQLPGAVRIVLSETERKTRLGDIVSGSSGEIALAVGPEGGWADDELDLFEKGGWTSASLGSTVLRAETAAIATAAIAMNCVECPAGDVLRDRIN